MASNSNTYADATDTYEDWIELYNPSNAAVDLAGYYMTDDLTKLQKHHFSDVPGQLVVPAKGYIILWASNNVAKGIYHLAFGLSAGGEAVALVAPDGTTVLDNFTFPAQKSDISMGRSVDGAGTWAFLSPATPFASNNAATPYTGFLAPPSFSRAGGIYSENFNLELTTTEPGASVLYTLDGSTPTSAALEAVAFSYKNNYVSLATDLPGTFLYDSMKTYAYTAPLAISDRSSQPNRVSMKSSTYTTNPDAYTPKVPIKKANVIRARVVKPGYLPSDIVMHSYFPANAQGKLPYTLPVISLGIPENYLYSWDSGITTAGSDFDSWRAANPTVNASLPSGANWKRDSEFPLSMELFSANDGNRILGYNAGFSMHGGNSRILPQKTFRLYFRSEYGQSDLDYPIFPNQANTDYKRLLLRNGGNELGIPKQTTFLRDMAMGAIVRRLNFSTQAARPNITYINGEYWGIYSIYERYDRFYIEQKFGIPEGELDLLEKDSEPQEGDNTHYLKMRDYIRTQDITAPAVYDSVLRMMDVENFIDYESSEIYLNNVDWPSNNIRYFRKRTNFTPNAPYGQDGRWRWMMYDMDKAFGPGFNGNRLLSATDTANRHTAILGRLLLNPTFRQQFITRYLDLSNSAFLPAISLAIIDSLSTIFAPEVPEHVERWKDPASTSAWASNLNVMTTFANKRPEYSLLHMEQKFGTTGRFTVSVNVNDASQGYIKVNTIDIIGTTPGISQNPYPWTGTYLGGVPVRLVAFSKPGYRFVRWEGDTTSVKDSLVLDLKKARSVVAVFEAAAVAQPGVVQYWHFNNLPSGTIVSVPADSTVTGNATITYSGTGNGYMDRTNDGEGSLINAQYGQPAGYALRPRNPSDTRVLDVSAPTTGFKDIKLSYAVQRTGSGAQYERLSYSKNGGITWTLIQDSIAITEPFQLYSIDLSSLDSTANNPLLLFRIAFLGTNAAGTSGNNRLDNFLLTGLAAPASCKGEWTGAADADWFNPANWCNGVPGAADAVLIKAGKPHYPAVGSSVPVTIKSFSLETGASFKLLPETVFTVKGGACTVKGDVQLGSNARLNIEN